MMSSDDEIARAEYGARDAPEMLAPPWKSGASASRKAIRINPGFSPRWSSATT